MNHGAVLLLCVCLGRCSAVIYNLNDTEYDRMPPIYHMEPYDPCFTQPGGLYCAVDFALVSDTPNPLMEMIQEYSEATTKHFNHSKLTYGVCVTTACAAHNSTDLRLKLESCLNDTMWSEYGLKTQVPEKFYCVDDKKMVITTADFAVAGCILLLLLLNVVGTCYDLFADPEKNKGIKLLLCFSLRRNWRRLVAPAADGSEPRVKRFKAFNGVKTMAMFLVIMAHSMIISGYFVNNTHFVEKTYDNLGFHLILNGTVIVQTFFIISGFLLAYNLRLYAEKQNLNWLDIIKAVSMRWLRLTPPYAVVMAFVLTWYRHLGRGPIWQKVVGSEIADCEKTWWLHLLYVNNYVDGSECLSQTWYLAADTQLYVMGVIVCVVCTSPRSRAAVLSLLFAIGVVIPAAITYYRDLDGVVISSPEATRGFYVHDSTYSYIEAYSRGHTNIPSYILGIALGHITYYAQTSDYDTNKLKKYRFLTWLLLPVGILIVATGRFFYLDAPRSSLLSRVTAATLIKPIYGFVIACALGSSIFKVENYLRGVQEWRGWTSLSRVTYSAYLCHYPFVKYFLGTQVSLLHISFLFASEIFLGTIVMSFLMAFPIWLLIEAPLAQLIKFALQIGTKEKEEKGGDGKPVFNSYNSRPNM